MRRRTRVLAAVAVLACIGVIGRGAVVGADAIAKDQGKNVF
jgi:hypothetical protein